MKKFFHYMWSYRIEILLSLFMMSNLYIDIPSPLYYALWLFFIYLIFKDKPRYSKKRTPLVMGLVGVIVFSTFFSTQLGLRFVLMSVLLFIILAKTSLSFFKFKVRFLWCLMFFFALSGPINFYAHTQNINYMLYNWRHWGEEFTLDFSGFTCHPMWLSAACGIGIIFCVYWLLRFFRQKKYLWMVCSLVMLYSCVMVTIWGGSRSATFLSLAAGLLLVFLTTKKVSNYVAILGVVGVLAVVAMPQFIEASERMQTKYGGLDFQTKDGTTSRTSLWNARIEEFKSSPIWGVGFGVTGLGAEASEGRSETGSGWLTVLSQTGLIGFVLVCLLVKRAFLPLRLIRRNSRIALFTAILVYLCLHSLFEAYMFQAGWYLCFVFWLLVSVLDDYRRYHVRRHKLRVIHVKRKNRV